MTDKDFEFITDKIGIWFANLKLKSFRHTFDGDTYPSSALVTDYELFVAKLKKDIKFIPEEPVSEDLEEALECKVRAIFDSLEKFDVNDKEKNRVAFGLIELEAYAKMFYNIGKQAGVQWQKEQMMAKAFDFTKEHNTACVLASECLRGNGWFSRERDFNDLFRHLSCVDELFEGKFSGKTKVIVIKED